MISRFLISTVLLGATGALAADPAPTTRPAATPPPAAAPATTTPAAAATTAPQPKASVESPRRASNAAAANAGNATSVEAFRIIGDRNIFNANRSGRRERSSEDQGPRVDQISFVGTIDYAKGKFALFDGSDSAYRKGMRAGDSIAQFKITNVTATTLELEREGKTITLQIGQQLRRAEGGDWTVIGADIARTEAQAARAAQQAAGAPPAIPADASDVVRRMMERRMQQSKQP